MAVTNLNDSGSGSFRACAEASGARTCVFRVGGTIAIASPIRIQSPYLTIAGQTAPGGGITINGLNSSYGVIISTHDIIMRYIRVRMGWTSLIGTQEGSPIWIGNGNCYNIIMDHIDLSWTRDENLTIWRFSGQPAIRNITLSWSIDSEPLAGHPTSYGIGASDTASVAGITDLDMHHNLNMNASHRIPLIGIPNIRWVNNITYNWAFYAVQMLGGVTGDYIGNYWKPGPLNSRSTHEIQWGAADGAEIPGNPSIYLLDNKGYHVTNPAANNWPLTQQVTGENGSEIGPLNSSFQRATPQPALQFPIVADDVNNLESVLLPTVGASQRLDCNGNWVNNRDAVDLRLINNYNTGTGTIPNTQDDVGGYPVLAAGTPCQDTDGDGIPDAWEIAHGLNPNDPSDGAKIASNGYTNLDNYLNGTAVSAPTPVAGPPTITTTILPSGTAGTAYTAAVVVSGGTAPLTFTASGLAPGLSIAGSTGQITGTPTTSGTFIESVTVTDSKNLSASQSYTVVIAAAPAPPPVPPSTPPTGTNPITLIQNATFSRQPTSGGTVTLALPQATGAGHALIVGVSFWPLDISSVTDGSGDTFTRGLGTSMSHGVSGSATYTNFYYAKNTAGGTPSLTLSFSGGNTYLLVAVAEVAGLDPSAPLDQAGYNQSLTATSSWSSAAVTTTAANEYLFSWGATEASNPTCATPTNGWTMESQNNEGGAAVCLLDRIVSAAGPYQASVTPSIAQNYAMEIATFKGGSSAPAPSLLTVSTTSLPNGTVGTSYSMTLTATGGTSPYSWSATGLPNGLTISAGGSISGTPTASGAQTANVAVTDSTGATASKSLSIAIVAPPPAIAVTCSWQNNGATWVCSIDTSKIASGQAVTVTATASGVTATSTGTRP